MLFRSGFINTLAESIVISIMNERFSDAAKKPDAPFLGASFSSNNFFISKTMGAYFLSVSYKENNWSQAFGEAIKMLYSAKEHGFTDAEIERAKKRYLKSYENQYNEREKMNNSAFVGSYKNSFTSGNSFPSIETYYEVINKYLPEYPNELINAVLKENIKGINENILVNGIDKEEFIIPNETEVLAFFNEAKQQQFEAYAEKEIKSTLIDKLPKKGKIKKEKKTDYETTTLTLSNGAQIIVKNTDFNKSNIAFNCFKRGGTSMYPDDNTWSLSFLTNSLFIGGVGEFSVQDLNKAIAGKSFSLSPYMRKVSQGIQGSTTPEDLEAMLQTLYLYFTASRKDQEVFDATIKKVGVSLQNSKGTPQQIFSDSLLHTLYNHHPKGRNFRFEDIDSLDYDRLFEIQKQAFSNGGDFKFIFVGNIDLEKAKPLFEQYIGSLPSTKKSVEPELDDLYIAEGLRENRFETRMQTPKVTVLNAYTGAIDYNLKNIISVNLFQQIMSMVYTKTIREEGGNGVIVSPFLYRPIIS